MSSLESKNGGLVVVLATSCGEVGAGAQGAGVGGARAVDILAVSFVTL